VLCGPAKPVYFSNSVKPEFRLSEAGEFWRLDLSARSFRALLKNSDSIVVQENPTSYLLTLNADKPAVITHATLRIDKQSTRSVEQTLILNQNGVTSEVHFVEIGFEQKSLDAAPPSAFEPDKEFGNSGTSLRSPEHSDGKTVSNPEAVASVELEIEVTYLLNRIKANLGEQISVSRSLGGALRVEAVTERNRGKQRFFRYSSLFVTIPPCSSTLVPSLKQHVGSIQRAIQKAPSIARLKSRTVADRLIVNCVHTSRVACLRMLLTLK
jgi:hypothetical protein